IVPLVANIQGFPVVPFALTDSTRAINIRQKVHLYFDKTFTPAGIAAPTCHIKAKTPWSMSPAARFTAFFEQGANRGKKSDIGGRVGARGTTNRALVNTNDFIHLLQTANLPIGGRFG